MFKSINIIPYYGKNTAIIKWYYDDPKKAEGSKVYIYRSHDGVRNWELLNKDNPIQGLDYYADNKFTITNRADVTHYRLCLQTADGKLVDSPIRGVFSDLSRKEFGMVRKILSQEYRRAGPGRNGFKVRLYKPDLLSSITPGFADPDTGQSFQSSIDKAKGGTKKGWRPYAYTYIENMQISPKSEQDTNTGVGGTDARKVRSRALAIPIICEDDVIVNEATDDRYGVDSVQIHYFRGLVPVACDLELTLLKRGDARYNVFK